MREVPLATVDVRVPPRRETLRRRLADLSLPPRTQALLGDSCSPEATATATIRTRLRTLVNHLVCGSTDSARYDRAVSVLVGLGPGLTPTGDDLLVAILAMGRLLSGGREAIVSRPAVDGLAAAIATRPAGLTTEVGQQLLTASVAGRYPEPLAAFVAALGERGSDREMLNALVTRLTAIGAHSGADWLAGVVALGRACTGKETPCSGA